MTLRLRDALKERRVTEIRIAKVMPLPSRARNVTTYGINPSVSDKQIGARLLLQTRCTRYAAMDSSKDILQFPSRRRKKKRNDDGE